MVEKRRSERAHKDEAGCDEELDRDPEELESYPKTMEEDAPEPEETAKMPERQTPRRSTQPPERRVTAPAKKKSEMSNAQILAYARMCNAYLEHQDEMEQYEQHEGNHENSNTKWSVIP